MQLTQSSSKGNVLGQKGVFSFDCLMQVMKSIVDEQWQNSILIFSRVKN